MKKLFIVPAAVLAASLSSANLATAQDSNAERTAAQERNSTNETQNAQGRVECEICGLTVEQAQGEQQGLKIVEVKRESPADKAGLKKGDIVTNVAGQSLTSPEQLKQTMQQQSQASKSEVLVTVRRDDRNRRVTLDLDRDANRYQQQERSQVDHSRTEQDRHEQDRYRQSRSEAGRSEQDRYGQDRREQGQVGQGQSEWTRVDQQSAQRRSESNSEQYRRSDDSENRSSMRQPQSQDRRSAASGRQYDGQSAEGQGYLGVTLDANADGQGQGVRISRVDNNSPAQRAGLKIGDRILKVNGQTLSNPQDLVQMIQRMDPNQSAELTVIADGGREEIDVQLASKAQASQRSAMNRQAMSSGAVVQSSSNYSTAQTYATPGTVQYRNQADQGVSNESLTQVLREIRQELQQLRQQVSRLDSQNVSRGQSQYSAEQNAANWSQSNRDYDDDRYDDNRYDDDDDDARRTNQRDTDREQRSGQR